MGEDVCLGLEVITVCAPVAVLTAVGTKRNRTLLVLEFEDFGVDGTLVRPTQHGLKGVVWQ